MENSSASFSQLAASAKQFARRLLVIGENRLELLTVEVQEERERLLQAILLALGIVALGSLAVLTFTAAIVVLFWAYSPVVILLILTAVYGFSAIGLYWRFRKFQRDWQPLSATLEQLRKDRACVENILV